MTIKWKPTYENFHEFSANQEPWDSEALLFFTGCSTSPTISNPHSSHGQHLQLTIQRKFLKSLEKKAFNNIDPPNCKNWNLKNRLIFGIRVCLGTTPPGLSITNSATQAVMTEYDLQIHISNAKSDSGENTTAGTIFFKHPDFTHKNFEPHVISAKLTPINSVFRHQYHPRNVAGFTPMHRRYNFGHFCDMLVHGVASFFPFAEFVVHPYLSVGFRPIF
jgi:hypothetical protein